MSESMIVRSDEAVFENSVKHANTGKVGSFNHMKRITFEEQADGTVVMSVYSQKITAPGYVMKFSPQDWVEFHRAVRRISDKQKKERKNAGT